jgi:diadenylate cyclase
LIPLDRIQGLWTRVRSYDPVEVAIEFIFIWLVVYSVVIFVRGTRAAGALKGLLVILIIATVVARVLGQGQSFQRLTYLYDKFLAVAAVGLIIIFQPELRRALVRLGETPIFRSTPAHIALVVDSIVDACAYFSRAKFGAIMAIERQVGLKGLVEDGTPLNAELSAGLLQTIFFPGTALHDLAVVIKDNRVLQAGVQLPLAEPAEMSDPRLGSRHRAAVGLTKECDAVVVVVSEETGQIRVAERGRLSEELTPEELRTLLVRLLRRRPVPPAPETYEAPPKENEQ